MIFNRIVGFVLLIAALLGYCTVADDFRHVGEFVGVSSILLAGLILLAGSTRARPSIVVPARWISLGILPGMIIGAVLDNMLVGVGIGLAVGTAVAWAFARTHQTDDGNTLEPGR